MAKRLAPLTQGEQNTLRTTNVGRYVILGDNTRVVVTNVSRVTQGKICMKCALYTNKTPGDAMCPYMGCCTRPNRPDGKSVIFVADNSNRKNKSTKQQKSK